MANPIARVYDETLTWGRGPLDWWERECGKTICDQVVGAHVRLNRSQATEILAMCGLLRKDGKP